MKQYLPPQLAAFWAALAAGTVLSMVFLDQPVALFASHVQGGILRHLFELCAAPSLLALPLSGLYLAWLALHKLFGKAVVNPVWLAASLATLGATAAKDELKWIFGRSWPDFWLRDGVYGFRPFTNGYMYGSFPSGHTAYITAPLGVLWALRPEWRPLCGAIIASVMFGLVAGNFHFLADVLAGLITGTVCSWGTLILLKPRHG